MCIDFLNTVTRDFRIFLKQKRGSFANCSEFNSRQLMPFNHRLPPIRFDLRHIVPWGRGQEPPYKLQGGGRQGARERERAAVA